ncbi:hypothetical protein D3C79_848180 [compost metagenome]
MARRAVHLLNANIHKLVQIAEPYAGAGHNHWPLAGLHQIAQQRQPKLGALLLTGGQNPRHAQLRQLIKCHHRVLAHVESAMESDRHIAAQPHDFTHARQVDVPFFIQHAHHDAGKTHVADLHDILLDDVEIHRAVAKVPAARADDRMHRDG